jgi:hypothetical protein
MLVVWPVRCARTAEQDRVAIVFASGMHWDVDGDGVASHFSFELW